ncbi:MAG: alginate biosynthesis protein Alg44 [Geminicoccaceae bacterium]|nr:alginate biosynthesis protein Alg44 [Geminicoccaceae bacterium]MCB9943444.1 alginate biosynthesis protein Alg44 [Geminicoccaceae bacterium]
MQPQVVHEAEVHRQHVRLKIPIVVEIDGSRFAVDDWSMGGFGILSEMSSRQPGENFPTRLIFPFEDFEVSLRLDCQMVYILDDSTRFGCKFLSMSRGQISLFRYLVDAYLSGEMVSGGDILHIAGRENTADAREKPLSFLPFAEEETTGRRIRRVLGYGALLLLGAGLLFVVATGFQDRFLTVHAESAVIHAPMTRLRAPQAGTLRPVDTPPLLEPGMAIARLEVSGDSSIFIESPCACVLLDWKATAGGFVAQGEEVAVLASADSPLLVRARVAFADALRMQEGDVAEITIPGRPGTQLGQIQSINFKPDLGTGGDANRLTTVVVRPDQPFDFTDLGSIVSVDFP